jgi:hypothetical protein
VLARLHGCAFFYARFCASVTQPFDPLRLLRPLSSGTQSPVYSVDHNSFRTASAFSLLLSGNAAIIANAAEKLS